MLPRRAMDSTAKRRTRYAVGARQFADRHSRAMSRAYRPDGIVVETRDGQLRALRLAAFRDHISHVVVMRPKEEVRRIDAGGIVPAGAVVADIHSHGHSSVRDFPGDVRSTDEPTSVTTATDTPIAACLAPQPGPTSFGSGRCIDLRPEAIDQRPCLADMVASTRAINRCLAAGMKVVGTDKACSGRLRVRHSGLLLRSGCLRAGAICSSARLHCVQLYHRFGMGRG